MNPRVAKTATAPAVARTPSLFYDSAREGMLDFLLHHCVPGRRRILLPSFIGWSPVEGSGVFDPVRELGLDAHFYELEADLSVRRDDFERQLSATNPAVVVLIHYFGRTQPELVELAQAARRHGAVVVEDLAHGFFSAQQPGPAGRHGDLLLFSLHKMFATPGARGGLVTYRDGRLLTRQRSTRAELASFVLDFDWRTIAERRRSNFEALSDLLLTLPSRGSAFDLLWPALSSTDVPQTLPVRIHTGNRDAIYHRMNAEGFGVVSLYHTLIPEVCEIGSAMSVAHSILNFPVHQDVDVEELPHMLSSFEAALVDEGQ